MEVLEIQVKDEVRVFDNVGEAVALLEKIVQEIMAYEEDFTTYIVIRKRMGRDPPTLGINVKERIKTKEALS